MSLLVSGEASIEITEDLFYAGVEVSGRLK